MTIRIAILAVTLLATRASAAALPDARTVQCLDNLVQQALLKETMKQIGNQVAAPMGLIDPAGGLWMTKQTYFTGADGIKHVLAVNPGDRSKLLVMRIIDRTQGHGTGDLYVISPQALLLSAVGIVSGKLEPRDKDSPKILADLNDELARLTEHGREQGVCKS